MERNAMIKRDVDILVGGNLKTVIVKPQSKRFCLEALKESENIDNAIREARGGGEFVNQLESDYDSYSEEEL